MHTVTWTAAIFTLATLISNSSQGSIPQSGYIEPCAVIRDLQEKWRVENETRPLEVEAGLAVQCLLSVPLTQTDEIRKVTELQKYLQFQSTIDWAADPPKTGLYREPVNITSGLEDLKRKLEGNEFDKAYQVESAIRNLLQRVRDGHLKWKSPCLDGAFKFFHDFPLVHLWDERDETGKIYAANDLMDRDELLRGIVGRSPNNKAPFSAISTINHEPVFKHLQHFAETKIGSFHDPDALWNSLFATRSDGGIVPGAYTTSALIPDPLNFTVGFENGTLTTVSWKADIVGNFTNTTSGAEYYHNHCEIFEPAAPLYDQEETLPEIENTNIFVNITDRVPGYPIPLAKSYDNMLSSYIFPSSDSDRPIGVLAIHTFLALNETAKFTDFVIDTLDTFHAQNITNIIIDVTGNSGGNVALGYSTFAQFFPTINPSAVTNMRAHPAVKALVHSAAELIEELRENPYTYQEELDYAISSPFSFESQESLSGEPFTDWREAYGETSVRGENYTNLMRWNLSSPEFNITVPVAGQRWDTSEIVILGDGMCSSTCTLFVSAMVDAGVRTVTYGGRPQLGPMQIIGGVEGSQVLTFDEIWWLGQQAVQRALLAQNRTVTVNEDGTPQIHSSAVNDTKVTNVDVPSVDEMIQYLPRRRIRGKGTVNLRNAFNEGWDVPREVVYRASDYRLPLTREEWQDVGKLWRRVAKEVWHV